MDHLKNTLLQLGYLIVIFILILTGWFTSEWLDKVITGQQGGQVLQGGTFWKALSISFKDARDLNQRIPVDNISFKNVDPFLPIAIVAHINGRDSTFYSSTNKEQVDIRGAGIDSLIIRTSNASHSAVIDDLTFQENGRQYTINFDFDAQGNSIEPNSQLVIYPVNGIQVSFEADNAVPTVVRGVDLGEIVGRYISKYSGPLSTLLIMALLSLPIWMLLRYVRVISSELAIERFLSVSDIDVIKQQGHDIFQGGVFNAKGQGYAFDENTELFKILASSGHDVNIDHNRLVQHCSDRIYHLFDDIEDRLTSLFGMIGILALSLGLLGTVVGMIDAFKILEDTMKVGEGPAQTQLKMAHFINFALVTTAIGFFGRIMSIIITQQIKNRIIQNRNIMLDLVGQFNPHSNHNDVRMPETG